MSYVVIMLFSAIDYLFTLYHMSHGAQEWNPIMQGIMNQPFWASFILKNGWTHSFFYFYYFYWKGTRPDLLDGVKLY